MVCFATQVPVTCHVRETASVYAVASAAADSVSAPRSDTDRIEALEEEIVFLAAHIHAAEHRFLTLVAEYDRLRGWELGGHRSVPTGWPSVRVQSRCGSREISCGPCPGEPPPDGRRHEPGRALLLRRPGTHAGSNSGERVGSPRPGPGRDHGSARAHGARLQAREPAGRGGPGEGALREPDLLDLPGRRGHVRHGEGPKLTPEVGAGRASFLLMRAVEATHPMLSTARRDPKAFHMKRLSKMRPTAGLTHWGWWPREPWLRGSERTLPSAVLGRRRSATRYCLH